MTDEPLLPAKPPLDAHHFINVLAHLEVILEADLIAWNAQSSKDAEQRLQRLVTFIKRAAHVDGSH